MGSAEKKKGKPGAKKEGPEQLFERPMENPFRDYRQEPGEGRTGSGSVPTKVDLEKPMENPFEGIESVPRKVEKPPHPLAQRPQKKPEIVEGTRGKAEVLEGDSSKPRGKYIPPNVA
jgi:hypothetical protein